jgi:hypothetical protein
MFAETMNPAEIASATEIRRKAPKKAGHVHFEPHTASASPTHTSERAVERMQPRIALPLAGSPIRDAATPIPQPKNVAPHHEPILYMPDPAHQPIIDEIIQLQRLLQTVIRSKTAMINQTKAIVRSAICTDADYEDDNETTRETAFGKKPRRLTKDAQKRVADELKLIKGDPAHRLHNMVMTYGANEERFEVQQSEIEKAMSKLARSLPAYGWVRSVKGLGDKSFATLVGECGDIGSYKSVSAVWKRLGLAVMNGKRQGAPGDGATAQDWVDHGYSGKRRSVSWNARNQIIGGMGLWRPAFGEDVHANPDLTEYQRVFAERARYESGKLGSPVKCSDKGKESYSKHVINRAMRYTEKRMLKHLYLAWRRLGRPQ